LHAEAFEGFDVDGADEAGADDTGAILVKMRECRNGRHNHEPIKGKCGQSNNAGSG
jgi:hypothetical protein